MDALRRVRQKAAGRSELPVPMGGLHRRVLQRTRSSGPSLVCMYVLVPPGQAAAEPVQDWLEVIWANDYDVARI